MKVSIIIPVFNEEKSIINCLESLWKQSQKGLEIIVIDDGSTDQTLELLGDYKKQHPELILLKQNHKGPAIARNYGANHSNGEILVFVDADMTFDQNFIKFLIKPIEERKVLGTFSKEEYVDNKNNIWSRCWNINKNLPVDKMHPKNYPDLQPVFRAILKKDFKRVNGFNAVGYIDDYTLSEKLGEMAAVSPGAVFYHRNPENLEEVFSQARWIGKSEYKRRKIKNENVMRLVALIRYSLPLSIINGVKTALDKKNPQFILFKLIYDLGIEISLVKSFFKEQLYK